LLSHTQALLFWLILEVLLTFCIWIAGQKAIWSGSSSWTLWNPCKVLEFMAPGVVCQAQVANLGQQFSTVCVISIVDFSFQHCQKLLCLKSLWFSSVFHCSFIVQDAPAIVESHYDVRIVGCSGGVGGKHLGLILHAKFELQWDNLVGIVYEHDVHTRDSWRFDMETAYWQKQLML
jgi:hypothetical protein